MCRAKACSLGWRQVSLENHGEITKPRADEEALQGELQQLRIENEQLEDDLAKSEKLETVLGKRHQAIAQPTHPATQREQHDTATH